MVYKRVKRGKMNQQKVVVILLLVTIILSIFSVVLTLSVDASDSTKVEKETIVISEPPVAAVAFQIENPVNGGAE
jgi:hypothetical protein